MRTILTMLAVGTTAMLLSAPSAADDDFAAHGTVTAKRHGDSVTITVAGKGDWHVNMEYTIKVTLGAATLGKADAKYEGAHEGKAEKAVFEAKDPANEGTVKAVFCDKTSCSNPMKTSFKVK